MNGFWNLTPGAKILLGVCATVLIIEGLYINFVMGGNLTAIVAKGTSCERVLEAWEKEHENEAQKRTVFAGVPAAVDYESTPLKAAKEFKTNIDEAVLAGANFSGTFAIAQWACPVAPGSRSSGTQCQGHAIVNVATGKIITLGPTSEAGIGIAPESNVLIVNPKENFPTLAQLQKANLETLTMLANMPREYYILEGEGDNARLEKICTESPFEGMAI